MFEKSDASISNSKTNSGSPEKLIVIGNGFDLNCGLQSRIKDYFDSKEEMVKSIKDFKAMDTYSLFNSLYGPTYRFPKKNFTFWDFYFYENSQAYENWNNIESQLKWAFIKQKATSDPDIEWLKSTLESVSRTKKAHGNISDFIEGPNFAHMPDFRRRLLYIILGPLEYSLERPNTQSFFDLMFNQLKKFEDNFRNYLKFEIRNNRETYFTQSHMIFNRLTGERNFNLLSFNYTNLFGEFNKLSKELKHDALHCCQYRNIHGELSEEDPPIFGFDAKDVPPDSPAFMFTKTYRIMTRSSDYSGAYLLDKNIKEIIFYGHSLSTADYSYFQSIFDFYDIYDSEVVLIFFYSVYDEEKKIEIERSQFNAVSKLMNTYGNSFHSEKGLNLMHKLLLENRIIIARRDYKQ